MPLETFCKVIICNNVLFCLLFLFYKCIVKLWVIVPPPPSSPQWVRLGIRFGLGLKTSSVLLPILAHHTYGKKYILAKKVRGGGAFTQHNPIGPPEKCMTCQMASPALLGMLQGSLLHWILCSPVNLCKVSPVQRYLEIFEDILNI